MRHLIRHAAALGFAVLATPSMAETPAPSWDHDGNAKLPYIFTQQHNVENRPDAEGRVQLIRRGYPLQVQLPGNPAVWTFDADASALVEYRGRTMVYSPNRIAGTHSILVFDLAVSPDAKAGAEGKFTFTTDALPASLENVVPGGVYVVRFTLIDPD